MSSVNWERLSLLKRIGEKMTRWGRSAEVVKEEDCLSLIYTKVDLPIRKDRVRRKN